MADAVAASTLLPVLIDEIRRLKDLHTLAAGVTELPVKDAVVREELAQLRNDFAQIKMFFGSAGASMTMASSSEAPTTEAAARKGNGAGFGQSAPVATEYRKPARPRMHSVNISEVLPLPEGCETHFFLVSIHRKTRTCENWLIGDFPA